MVIHRFHLPPARCLGDEIQLEGREAHHAQDVLRLRVGDRLEVLDGAGAELLCDVREVSSKRLQLAVRQRQQAPPRAHAITLLQAIPKGRAMETIVQKATELGAARIVPLLSERTVPNLEGDSAEAKRDKWQQVAVEAIKQCGNPWLPAVELPTTPREFLARREQFELPLVGSLLQDRRHPRQCFSDFERAQGRLPRTLCAWIGPEGDFTPAELGAIKAGGALPITLGPLVLRSETAAIYTLAVLAYELQGGLVAGPA
jgi:16S rRNA (uracil1498-N3)-methyltransferase